MEPLVKIRVIINNTEDHEEKKNVSVLNLA